MDGSAAEITLQNYSEKPRIQLKIIGGASAIRPFDLHDKRDMTRMHILDKETVESMDEAVTEQNLNPDGTMTAEGLKIFLTDKESGITTAIVASEEHPRSQEKGEVQGFTYLYPQEPQLTERMQQCGQLPITDKPIWEISWARKSDARAGQIASGVRSQLGLIYQSMTTFSEQVENGIVTSVKPDTHVIVTAFIENDNAESQFVAQACGFEQVGQIAYYPEDVNTAETTQAWVLNWDKLQESNLQKADKYWQQKM